MEQIEKALTDRSSSLRILILSTHRPKYSAGLGADIMRSLREAGHKVDFLCLLAGGMPKQDYKSIERRSLIKPVLNRLLPRRIKSRIGILQSGQTYRELMERKGMIFHDEYEIHYPDENTPGLPTDRLLKHIRKDYDLVITLWWFDFINSTSLKALYDKLRCPIMILSIDMAPVTGGCFYFNSCRRFAEGCGRCPAIGSDSPDDFTHRNYLIKRDNYANMNCAFLGNSWMNGFAVQSGLFPPGKVFKIGCIIDEHEFVPGDRRALREKMGLPPDAIILLARSSSEPRKGARFIIHALNDMPAVVSAGKRIVLVSIGDSHLKEQVSNPDIPHEYMGRVNRRDLIALYQVSDYFLSPSIDDAGPSMVNQAQMCGTPVVCFNNGTAVDVVTDGVSGFKTDNVSETGFSDALYTALNLALNDPGSYERMRISTRDTALDTCSKARFQKDIVSHYKTMTS